MLISKFAGLGLAAVLSMGVAAAQTPQTTPNSQTPTSQTPQTLTESDVMQVTGCLIKESDYRSAHGLGKGALAGAGLGDEFVLVDATVTKVAGATATGSASPTPAATPSPSSAPACSEMKNGPAYR